MRSSTPLNMFQPTRRMMVPVPKEDQSAHTISQRLRQWRRIPPELVPLGIVVGVAVAFGAYSLGTKLMDKQMRLSRQNRGHD
ncbi:hypothetical protein VC83_03781 [Pseudogymnoascus destructans]|uniref:NADH-ubiquinone reductase complex 1 MLRQ subunit n=1 Tax=Pseudogymnoascus destructans TaxID=655981 RepID=A0A177AC90_9PEZI|nr:uncharacterized protein VC83_03781 [Pseudogymnoascus destructans]OAF59725.1 hypothetical protein VC83_03781 [Pseudogymnoascus destructans]